jgi:osmotically inducible protein OsmC
MTGSRTSEPAQVVRSGRVSWLTGPPVGGGRIAAESRAFGSMMMSVPEGAAEPEHTTPGELLAVAHGAMMATALAGILEDAGTPAREVVVAAHAAFSGPTTERELMAVSLEVYGRVPGLEQEAFERAAASARARYLHTCGTRADLDGELSAALLENDTA